MKKSPGHPAVSGNHQPGVPSPARWRLCRPDLRKSSAFPQRLAEYLHVLTDGTFKALETLLCVNCILSHRVISYLKEGGFTSSLEKLRVAPTGRRREYSLVDHHSSAVPGVQ